MDGPFRVNTLRARGGICHEVAAGSGPPWFFAHLGAGAVDGDAAADFDFPATKAGEHRPYSCGTTSCMRSSPSLKVATVRWWSSQVSANSVRACSKI